MPLFWTSQAYRAITVCAILRTTSGTPSLAFPINSQVPPVAYVEQPYEFTFSPTTYTTDSADILYVLADNPAWLSIDSWSRKFYGTPTYKDVGAANFRLIASDKTGQTTSNVVLVTLQNSTISTGPDILTQLEGVGSVSAPATLLLHQLQSLSFDLPASAFQGVSSTTHYYAVSADGSPLPSWLQFNSTNLQFAGTAPPLLVPESTSQAYDFKLAASNVAGFSEVVIHFQIMVGSHLLAFTNPRQNISVTRGSRMEISTLLQQLTLDGKKVSRSDMTSITSTAPDWLNFDDRDISFEGTVPVDAESSAFMVSAHENNSNTANITVLLQVVGAQVVSEVDLGFYNATTGTFFSHVVQKPASAGMASSITADLGALSSWLRFNSENLTLYGVVPTRLASRTFTATITFNDTASMVIGALTLNIVVKPLNFSSTMFYTRSSETASSTAAATSTKNAAPDIRQSSTQKDHATRIVLCTVPPVIFLLMILTLLLCVLHRKRKKRQAISKRSEKGNHSPVSELGVIPATTLTPALTLISRPRSTRQRGAVRPPRTELPWAPDSTKGTRRRLSKRPRILRSSMIGPSWDDLIRLPTPAHDLDGPNPLTSTVIRQQDETDIPLRASTLMTAANTADDDVATSPGLESIDQSQVQRASAIPISTIAYTARGPKRMSGAGHGAVIQMAGSIPPYRSSWQTTFGTMPLADNRRSTILQESFFLPQPQTEIIDTDCHEPNLPYNDTRPTLWLVDTPGDGSNDFETARQRFYTDRARDQLEGSSRFANISQSRIPPKNILNPKADRSSSHPLSAYGNVTQSRYTPQSWSQWSTVGPAVTINRKSTTAQPVRDYSVTSSRQFDSAISSDSQWEDEDLVADENSAGERYWQTNTAVPVARVSPRLPFKQDGHKAEDDLTADRKTRLNLADQRKRVSVGETELQRNQRSQKGSFRFI